MKEKEKPDVVSYFQPMGDRLLVLPDLADDVSSGGIIVPDMAKHRQTTGEVVAVGAGYLDKETGDYIALQVKVGDRVMYGKYTGTDITLNEADFTIISESDVMGILSEIQGQIDGTYTTVVGEER